MEATKWRKVEKAEWVSQTQNRGLVADLCQIGEPPVYTLNDFGGGKVWPESVVAMATGPGFGGVQEDVDEYFLPTN